MKFGAALKQMRGLMYAVAGKRNAAKEGEKQWHNKRRRALER